MKTSLLFALITTACIGVANAADYALFRVCQDQRIIRTSDGAEAGHIEYIVVDPSSREVISTVVSGGVEGDRLLAIPYGSLEFGGGNEIILREINRERLVSAPVIERTQISAAVIAPDIIQRTREHFGARGEVNAPGRAGERVAPGAPNAGPNGTSRTEGRPNLPPQATSPSTENPNTRGEQGNRPQNRRNANPETPNATPNANGAQPNHGRNFPSTNPRNEETPSAEGGNKTPRNANSREETPAQRAEKGEKPVDQPAGNAAAERLKKQAEQRGAEELNKAAGERLPQGSRPEAGARSLNEGQTNSPSSKKSPSSTEEKEKRSNEPRSPQL
jgi:hypothetical protein